MSTTVKTGWLKDKNGDKFAPKTLLSQVQTNDGTPLEDKLQQDIADAVANVEIAVDSALSTTSTNPVQNKVITASINTLTTNVNSKVPTSRTVNGKALSSNISLSASDVGAYSKAEVNDLEFITEADIDEICGSTITVATASEVTF
jgi:hypothetical protein